MYCKQCGKEIQDAKYCPNCGAGQGTVSSIQTQAQTPLQQPAIEKIVPIAGPLLVLFSLILPYVSVSVPIIGSRDILGLDMDIALIVLLVGIIGIIPTLLKKAMPKLVLGAGVVGLIIAAVVIPVAKVGIANAAESGGIFGQAAAAMVSITPGMGLILLAIGGVVMIYSGYKQLKKTITPG